MCSFNSSNTLVLCTVDWLQDGRAWMTQCSVFFPANSLIAVHCRISVSFSQPSILSTNEDDDDDFTVKLSGLFSDTIKTPAYPLSMSTIVSTVSLACASGHQTATPEMNWKSSTHTGSHCRNRFACASHFFLWLGHKFRTTEQPASESSCGPLSWPCLVCPQNLSVEPRSCPLSLDNFRVQVTSWFDVRLLHIDSSSSRQCNHPSFSVGSTAHAYASFAIQTIVSQKSSQLHPAAFFHSPLIHSDGSYPCTCSWLAFANFSRL